MTEKEDNIERVEHEIEKVSKSGEKARKNADSLQNLEAGKSDGDVKLSIFRQREQPYFETKANSGNAFSAMPETDIQQMMSKEAKSLRQPQKKKQVPRRKISNSLNNAPILPK